MSMLRKYPSNLTNEQWQIICKPLPKPKGRGRKPFDRRRIIDAILFWNRTGCQWRYVPLEFPNWNGRNSPSAPLEPLEFPILAHFHPKNLAMFAHTFPQSLDVTLVVPSGYQCASKYPRFFRGFPSREANVDFLVERRPPRLTSGRRVAPNWNTVYGVFRQWRIDGTWKRVHNRLREMVRKAAGKKPTPSAAIIDSQSVRTAEGREFRGFHDGKKIIGRKGNIVVNTLGMLLVVVVHSADLQDYEAGHFVLH